MDSAQHAPLPPSLLHKRKNRDVVAVNSFVVGNHVCQYGVVGSDDYGMGDHGQDNAGKRWVAVVARSCSPKICLFDGGGMGRLNGIYTIVHVCMLWYC